MQVKKFEAPTIQEALDNIKRELGPEAIILQTKKNRRGFGLLSKASFEITAAVSERSLQKKQVLETRMPDANKEAIKKLPAGKQAHMMDRYMDSYMESVKNTKDRVQMTQGGKKITATRYIDIEDEDDLSKANIPQGSYQRPHAAAQYQSQSASQQTHVPSASISPSPVIASPTVSPDSNQYKFREMADEVKNLKSMIEDLKKTSQEQNPFITKGLGTESFFKQFSMDTPALQEAFEQLTTNGVDRKIAYGLIKKASFELGTESAKVPEKVLDCVANEIIQTIQVISPMNEILKTRSESYHSSGPAVLALVGPTGVGKTLNLAKLASEASSTRNLRVGLINLDNSKITAFDQLGTYAKVLNLPFRSVSTHEDFTSAMMDFQNMDLVLVDTPGKSQKDPTGIKDLQDILRDVKNLGVLLVLSAVTRDAELYDIAHRFSSLSPKPEGIIFSKLDEASSYGAIYNLSQKIKIPLGCFSTGQKIPTDIEDATAERIAALVLNI